MFAASYRVQSPFMENKVGRDKGHIRGHVCVYYGYMLSYISDSFTTLGLWVLGLAVSHINESNSKLMSPEHYLSDKSTILLHPGTR